MDYAMYETAVQNIIKHVTRNDDRRDNIRWRYARVVYVTGGRMESSETHRGNDVELYTE